MTTSQLGQAGSGTPEALQSLFDGSPRRVVSTSAAAQTAFVLGLAGFLAAPFAVTHTLCLALAGVALVSGVVGLGRASRPALSGGLLASVGLVLALVTLGLVSIRYLGVDTTFGATAGSTVLDWLAVLNTLVPQP